MEIKFLGEFRPIKPIRENKNKNRTPEGINKKNLFFLYTLVNVPAEIATAVLFKITTEATVLSSKIFFCTCITGGVLRAKKTSLKPKFKKKKKIVFIGGFFPYSTSAFMK